jgi:CheY-like chemotaxis protein/anti-sigma regulatory factor (Ser/Thr protein kinase)
MMYVGKESRAYRRLEEAERATMRAADLTQQLLTFSKGGAPIKRSASIVEIIEESARFALSGSNVKCVCQFPDNLWSVEVDEGQMHQVFHNLVINADQAMPEGGIITVHADNAILGAGGPVQAGKYVKIVFEDQGTGISEEHIQKIFAPYFTTKEKGRGLGLAVVYSIIKNHGGHITVESRLGAGTTFTLYLPASDKPIAEEKGHEEEPIVGKGRILLMDDEDVVRDIAGEILKEIGYEVEIAKDGREALELYRTAEESARPFDVVIMDLTIPGGMGGKEAIKKLHEINPRVKAIVSSGYANDPVMANFRDYGFDAVIPKPYSGKDLSRIVHKILGRTDA